MGLRLILGRAGTGKTNLCLQEIREALLASPQGKALIFLVPEQASYQMERALLSTPLLGGTIRGQVYSFRRLAWRILQEVGGSARLPIGEIGKRMVLRQILEAHKQDLRVFHRSAERPGFADALAGTLTELKLYNIHDESLLMSQAIVKEREGSNLLADKLHDLALIYKAFSCFLADTYTDPDDYLNLLALRLPQSQALQSAEIWVDGFTGFTPQELKVLGALLKICDRVNVTLTLDEQSAEVVDETHPFYLTNHTYQKLQELVAMEKVPHEEKLILEQRYRFVNPLLKHLEHNFFLRPDKCWLEPASGLNLCGAVNRRSEVEGIAREMLRLCRDEGYRWRDMAIFVRQMEPYHALLTAVFQDFEIPFFLDHKRPVQHHPLIELIRSALEAVDMDWSYEPLFRYLKTDLVPIERERVDLLENYVLAHGIRGYRWRDQQPWVFQRKITASDQDQERANKDMELLAYVNNAREDARLALLAFEKKLKKTRDVAHITKALYELLLDLEVPATLARWSEEAEKEGLVEEARTHRQIWKSILDLMDQMVESLQSLDMDLPSYRQVLETGLESLTLGLIPPEFDQVFIASLDRSRSPEVKAAFIVGVSDGLFPARVQEDGIFDDGERERLKSMAGIELAPDSRRRLFEEQFHIYSALTRASECLYFTYPLADEEGKALLPSSIIGRLRELYKEAEEKTFFLEPPLLEQEEDLLVKEYFCQGRRALSYLMPQLREAFSGRPVAEVWWTLYSWFASQESWSKDLQQTVPGLWHYNQESPLPEKLSHRLYGKALKAGISRIEQFTACPFSQFLSHGLRLKDRALFRLQAPDLGQFFHEALKSLGEEVKEKKIDWAKLSDDDCSTLSDHIVATLAPQLQNEILLSTARLRYLKGRLQKTVGRAAWLMREHFRRGAFEPLRFEAPFGRDKELPPLLVPLSKGRSLELVGRIDRIDGFYSPERSLLRIIDYKSSYSRLALDEIYHGIRLQLLAYLDIALAAGPRLFGAKDSHLVQPAGMLYFTVQNPILPQQGPVEAEEAARQLLKKLKMQGLLLADPEVVQLMEQDLKGRSDILPVGLKKDGNFYSGSSIMTLEQFQILRSHLYQIFEEVGSAILDGFINLGPYKKKEKVACTFCSYKAICQFDQLLAENQYRILPTEPAETIWSKLQEPSPQRVLTHFNYEGRP
ncbi:helicase-exonuclease AddAB subunit AddB [Heliorestis acidaminivorans]|uniref:ATP-dependent helicase/deoxyribonuclease subunit B n=1 Tax=Heliorestis acidaminivorans TaxID=553427 RepID=A0A6I0F2Y2_9FIRM|nr:helicase-exonuclease AddAB subunit AddB [Heliorestis acidaminivorans]KAB2952718.1 helicase-exonuclease AddAB subunit AddB [Heliorestis acidaminivorans]